MMVVTLKDGDNKKFSHFNEAGKASMVDISGKDSTVRQAVAAGSVILSQQAYELVKSGTAKKGDVLGAARIAGILAAKKVDALIPLAHPLAINSVDIQFYFEDANCTVGIEAKVQCTGMTGVEMEALTAVSIAALTVYDMCKSVDKAIQINNIRLLQKTGGKSGPYVRQEKL
jgi:cyclic pyranopterin phosphate synthase